MASKTEHQNRTWRFPKSIVFLLLVVILAAFAGKSLVSCTGNSKHEKEIITIASLEKIVNVSELSTFTAIYNGVAEVKNAEDEEETEYYVTYEAKVNAGVDFENIVFEVDNEAKRISVTLPKIHITKISVDIASLDYIFVNDTMNTSAVSQEAYKACEADVQKECEQEEEIFELAKQNAENMMKALIQPFAEQLDSEYVLEINWKE